MRISRSPECPVAEPDARSAWPRAWVAGVLIVAPANREDEPVRVGLCAHCALSDDLAVLLDNGSGEVAPALFPLHAALTAQTHARSATIWLTSNLDAATLLRDIVRRWHRLTSSEELHTPSPCPRDPAAIVADTLGYSYQVADKYRHNSGATFIDYVNKRGS